MKRIVSLMLAACLLLVCLPLSAGAASAEDTAAAEALHELGLFAGVGSNSDGSPIYALDRAPTRGEGVAMLVRLLGKEKEAQAGNWATPFTDVPDWAKPYVGYAYANQLTFGTGDATFGTGDTLSQAQYLSFVLRALGYQDGTDFTWRNAAALSDQIGLTENAAASAVGFTRGSIAGISYGALGIAQKGTGQTLAEKLVGEGVFTQEQYTQAVYHFVDLATRTSGGKFATVGEFLMSAWMHNAIRLENDENFDVELGAEKDKLIYTFWLKGDLGVGTAELKTRMTDSLNSDQMVYWGTNLATLLKQVVAVDDPAVVVRVMTRGGESLASREYHAIG